LNQTPSNSSSGTWQQQWQKDVLVPSATVSGSSSSRQAGSSSRQQQH
jgi:hypothetical protein